MSINDKKRAPVPESDPLLDSDPDEEHEGEDKKGRDKDGQRRNTTLREDARLYGRVLSYLLNHKLAVAICVLFMVGEALTLVFSFTALKPVLDLIFEQKIGNVRKITNHYELTWKQVPASTGSPVKLGGYLFLPGHLEMLERNFPPETTFDVSGVEYATRRVFEESDLTFVGTPQRLNSPDARPWLRGNAESFSWWLFDIQQRTVSDPTFAFTVLKWTVCLFLFLTLIRVIFAFFAGVLSQRIGYLVIKRIRNQTYQHLLGLDFSFFANRSTGDLMSVVTADVSTLQQILTLVFSRFLQTPIQFVVFLIALLFISPSLTLLSLGAVFPIAAIMMAASRRVRHSSRRVQEHRAALNSVLQETVTGIQTVKAYGMEEHEGKKFGARNQRLYKNQVRRQAYSEIASQLNEMVISLAVVVILLLGGWFILSGDYLDGSDFVLYLGFLIQLFRPFKAWSKALVKIQGGLAGAERIFDLLDTRRSINEAPSAVPYTGDDTTMEWEQVTFRYERQELPALDGISLKIEAGNVLALVGAAGSGKSTIANLIPRFYDVNEGRVLVGGKDVRDYSIASLREKIAIVSQHVVIFDDSVRANIAYGREEIPLERIIEVAKAANIHDEIMAMPGGYDAPVGGAGVRLSGGQRQRIAIARALLKDAPILILDEATAALDVQNERMIQESLERLMHGRTTIMIAHRLATIQHADLICVLGKGHIVERGTHSELMELDGKYAAFQRLSTTGTHPDAPNSEPAL